jgi:O-antigen/teichoic acid export membrane protein
MTIQRSSITVFSSQIAFTIVGFLATMYFAHVLGAKILGMYFLFMTVVEILSLFMDVGLGAGTVKRISEGKEKSEFFTASLFMHTFTLAVALIPIYIFRDYFNHYIGADVLFFLILTLAMLRYSYLFKAVLVGEKKVGTSSILNVIAQLAKIGSQVILVILGFKLFGLLGGFCVGTFISIPLGIRFIEVKIKKPKVYHVKSIFSFSKYAFGIGFGEYLYQWMDLLVIGLLLPKMYAGVYGACWVFSSIAVFATTAIASTLFPYVSEWSANNKTKEIENAFKEGITYSLILAIPIFAGMLILSKDLLYYAYGSSFAIGWLVLIIMTGARLIEVVQTIIRHVLSGMDRPDLVFKITCVIIPLNLAANFVLVYTIGFVGAAIATLLTIIVSLTLGLRYIKGVIAISMPWTEIKDEVVSAIVMGVVVFLLAHYFSGLLSLVVCAVVGAVVYFGVLLSVNKKIRDRLFSLALSIFKLKDYI